MIQDAKYKALIQLLQELNKVTVAFSGGVDSTFLLYAAKEALGKNVLALTVSSKYIANWEIKEAIELCKALDIDHEILELPVADEIKDNPHNRCYLCKTIIFKNIKKFAASKGYPFVVEGTNADDTSDYRPGLKALAELNIHSPLLETGLTKEEIRKLSKTLRLPTWDKPAYACLLTRIPYNNKIKDETLIRIEKAENYLHQIGIKDVRVRTHGSLARIEVKPDKQHEVLQKSEGIYKYLKDIGYEYITLDIQGYRMGSFNETL